MYSGPATGLFSSPNPFSQTPAGTLRTADNVRFTAPGVIEPRRGYDYLTTGFGSSTSRADSIFFYAGDILAAYDLTSVALYVSSWTNFDTNVPFVPNGDNRMRFEGAARSAFFNPNDGIRVWDGVGGPNALGTANQPQFAGCPVGLQINGLIVGATYAGSVWMPTNTAVAYRFTICSKDAFGRVVEGPPSGRTVVRNSMTVAVNGMTRAGTTVTVNVSVLTIGLSIGDTFVLSPGEANFPAGTKTITGITGFTQFTYTEAGAATGNTVAQQIQFTCSVVANCYIPVDNATGAQAVNTNNFLRVYRSEETLTASDTPGDEMFQCYESGYLTAAQIAAGHVDFTDVAPESVLDNPLYTNENTGFGALQANYQPPIAEDIVYWANRMWYANTTEKNSAQLTLIGCGSPDGIQAGDKINFRKPGGVLANDVVFTANAGAAAANQFIVFTDGDPGYNIERTAQSLCASINYLTTWNSAISLYAYYISSEGGLPGQILLVSRRFGDAFSFSVYSDRETAWTPTLPDPTTPLWSALASTNDRHPARLRYSRLGIPDATPLTNFENVNSDNDAILRIFPLHYRLLVFKTDGIYTCSNQEPFTITKLSAYVLLAPDSVFVLEDRVYALTDQGIVTVSDAGVQQISNPIDDVFDAMMAPSNISTLATRAFGMAYRSDRQALLWTPGFEDGVLSTDNDQAQVYSTLSGGFTRYGFGARCGAIDPATNTLVFAPTDSNKLIVENKQLDNSDYYDISTSVGTAASVSGADITFAAQATVDLMAVGDVLASNADDCYPITAIDGLVVTVSGATGWSGATSLTLFRAISTEVEFNKMTDGRPADLKMVGQTSFLFRENGIHDLVASFSSEIASDPQDRTQTATGWGECSWGAVPYGSPTRQIIRIEPLPEEVAQCAQLSVGFSTSQAMAKYGFLGVDVVEIDDGEANHG